MSLTIEKFYQLRENFSEPKRASKECKRRLQRNEHDPYLRVPSTAATNLLAWKAELLLRTNGTDGPQHALPELQNLAKQARITGTDAKLLPFIYRLWVEYHQRKNHKQASIVSAGPEAQELFDRFAKSQPGQRARTYSLAFTVALEADCWEDVRWALAQYRKGDSKHRKAVFFDLIFAYQMSYEKQIQAGQTGMSATLPGQLATKSLLKAKENASNGTGEERLSEAKDIRFATQIFRRQKRGKELFTRMEAGKEKIGFLDGPVIADIMAGRSSEFLQMKLDVMREEEMWSELWDVSKTQISQALDELQDDTELPCPPRLQEWKLLDSFLSASAHLWHDENIKKEGLEIFGRLESMSTKPREVWLALLTMTAGQFKDKLLYACLEYWKRNYRFNCCFKDLRRFVEQLNHADQKQFLVGIADVSTKLRPRSNVASKSVNDWFTAEINVCKFDYLLTISCPQLPKQSTVEQFVCNSMRLYKIGRQLEHEWSQEAGCLALTGLLVLHHTRLRSVQDLVPVGELPNERILTQAALLVQHMTEGEVGKNNRPLVLLSTRLLLFCGFGTLAFDLYSHAKVKEILNDTCSHILLSHIAHSHPFDASGTKRMQPEAELVKVIRTMERMEDKVREILSTDISTFQFDQAFAMRDLKQSLRSSLTKHLCALQRRKIAHLKGEHMEDMLKEDFAFLPLTDNRDLDILPNYEASYNRTIDHLCVSVPYPDADLYLRDLKLHTFAYRLLHQDARVTTVPQELDYNEIEHLGDMEALQGGHGLLWAWFYTALLSYNTSEGTPPQCRFSSDNVKSLIACIPYVHNDLTRANPDAIPNSMVDRNVLVTEALLLKFFGELELLRFVWKLCLKMKERQAQKGEHWLKSQERVDQVSRLSKLVEEQYEDLRKQAQKRMDRLEQYGEEVLMAHAKYGPTGEALIDLVSQGNVRIYARNCVESTKEALRGVLKVKLK
ncbi:hypothetical protein GQ43DRAFT_464360 [Delitschia confertaspora ATCC 74209]|uniref:Uncharacterized protein n=1 Tax=Delitschia confertaspora ATCC 74209 TaxID=1513339 RepID=A0A9P4MR39_9PLEO|nr:hypothetical protein GQ43DRAFT_464360 [Delitschia confertaspora ATCC 74209]